MAGVRAVVSLNARGNFISRRIVCKTTGIPTVINIIIIVVFVVFVVVVVVVVVVVFRITYYIQFKLYNDDFYIQ